MENVKNELEMLTAKAETLKAIAHPVRLCILKGLLDSGACNVSKMQYCLDLPQSTISQHLSKLRMSGLITAQRQGIEVYYSITDEQVRKLISALFN
ncbi:ArsR/SmtB family transcription factor [Zhaonella formicivorans]|jgi:ArsR family transcriptional regulator|uniref:ArsR/SmtB family transcription factor n=1 Tax=Zhaonella formicivorans TaxID=2528593 RepID=UPI0010DA6CC4|nr:metalloregulator ArsR/SmtB family transcription factor [Zhaonella formicivorans]